MANNYVQVPPNSTGVKMQTYENTVSGNVVDSEAVTPTNSAGAEIGTSGNPIRTDPTGTTTQPVSGTVSLTAGQAVELLDAGGTNKASISAAGAMKVDGSAATQPVSGTVTADIVGYAGATLDAAPGSTAPTNGLQVGGTDGTNFRPFLMDTAGQAKVLIENASAIPVSLPAGQAVELLDSGGTNKASISAAGALKVDGSAATQPVSGTVTADIVGHAGAILDAVLGAVLPPNAILVGGSDGTDLRAISTDASGVVQGNIKNVGGAAVATAASGTMKVGIVGNAGAAVDAVAGGSAPANVLQVGGDDTITTPGSSILRASGVTPALPVTTIPPTYSTAGATASQVATVVTQSPNSGMPAIVQKVSTTGTGAQASLQSASFTVTAGNTLVVVAGSGSSATLTVTDTLGHSYIQATENNSNTPSSWIFYCPNIIGGPNRITIAAATSVSLAFEVYEVSGIVSPQGGWTNGATTVNTTFFTGAVVGYDSGFATSSAVSIAGQPVVQSNVIGFACIALATTNSTPTTYQPWTKDADLVIGGTPSGLVGLHTFSVGIGSPGSGFINGTTFANFAATITSAPWAASFVIFAGQAPQNVSIASPLSAAGALLTDVEFISGLAIATAASGVQKVGIVGHAGANLDAVVTAATSPPNGLAVLSRNVTTAPSLTTGQSVALQSDYQGSVFVKPYRRGQTVAATGNIASATPANILGAQAAGIFADLSSLVLTLREGATANIFFGVLVSDGTASYRFNFLSQDVVTFASAAPLNMSFDPPIPATTAATAWTIALTSATDSPSVDYVAVFVLQKAS